MNFQCNKTVSTYCTAGSDSPKKSPLYLLLVIGLYLYLLLVIGLYLYLLLVIGLYLYLLLVIGLYLLFINPVYFLSIDFKKIDEKRDIFFSQGLNILLMILLNGMFSPSVKN